MEMSIPDESDTANTGRQSKRAQVKGYRLRYFCRKFGLTIAQGRGLLASVGHNRAKLISAALELKSYDRISEGDGVPTDLRKSP